MIRNIILTLIGLCFSLLASANSVYAQPYFSISPTTCLVDKNSPCQQAFIFNWQLDHKSSFCVYEKGQSSPLFCVEDSQQGHSEITLSLKQGKEFVMKGSQQDISAHVAIEVLGQDYRKIRRRLWSVF
ncbi:DUF3019 domain-containing protein [Thalassotalea sp. PLHSN55]|uniref:DUF3019 domain-containing protein n=1 Tax=Thalassotalea sp. PLHSN55 TaxID=3435888 RepID=UPI003F875C28